MGKLELEEDDSTPEVAVLLVTVVVPVVSMVAAFAVSETVVPGPDNPMASLLHRTDHGIGAGQGPVQSHPPYESKPLYVR